LARFRGAAGTNGPALTHQASSAANEGEQFYKRDFGVHFDVEFLLEAFGLFIADEEKEAVFFEGGQSTI
jgi:hypothetical protein